MSNLVVSLACGVFLAAWMPTHWGWARLRIPAFFVLWQVFTPPRSAYADIPMLLLCIAIAEGAYWAFTRRGETET